MQIRDRRAFVSGFLFLAIAIAFLVASLPFDPGTSARMGPGYFPRMLSLGLGILGLVVMLRAVRSSAVEEGIEPLNLRPLFWIAGPVALFALVLPFLGLALSIALLVLTVGLASTDTKLLGSIVTAIVLAGLSILVFVVGIGLRVPVWPNFG